ncbi:MAG: hypothetical protein J0L81_15915 [Caulobacterales bacterium]|nr:hypothetical protein [Caulobacterales bacterium]
MLGKRVAAFFLFAALLVVDPGATAAAYPASSVDYDRDGIPDEWERRGRGALTPDMVRVGRRDLIIYVIRRGGISEAATRTLMERVRRFYDDLPIENPDGTYGIAMTVIYAPEMPREDWGVRYDTPGLAERYLRPEWRGIARTYILETAEGAGGQTLSAEWAASGPPWQAVAHEIGHQIGMGHAPPNQTGGRPSPLWPSLMNYTYSYNFNGSPDAIQFSQGAFLRTPLNETRLSETLPYSRAQLEFLERAPNYFTLETRGANLTGVDWNRNGSIDSGIVRADINDGYGVEGAWPSLIPDRTSGAPALASVGDRLVVVYPRLATDPATWTSADMSADPTGRYYASVLLPSGEMSTPRAITAGGARAPSNPSATGVGNLLGLAHTQNRLGLLALYAMTDTGVGARRFILTDFGERMDQTIVASARLADGSTPVHIVAWDRERGSIRIATVRTTGSGDSMRFELPRGSYRDISVPGFTVRSAGPIAAAVDPLNGELVIAYQERVETRGVFLRVARLRSSGSAWGLLDRRWVGGAEPRASGTAAPSLTLDPAAPISGRSQINVYTLTAANDAGLARTIKYREIADRGRDDGWRSSMMIDEWNNSLSATSAVRFGATDAFALRWKFDDPRPNLLVIYPWTAISNAALLDHDDIRYIAHISLAASLRNLRCYLGETERVDFELTPSEC